jgi:membrane protein implicated in regulation of membrane protease activity
MTDDGGRKRILRWGLPEPPIPKHPYRDTLLVYAGFAVFIVLLGWATGGSVTKAIVVAAVVYVAASAWSLARWHQRLRREAARREALEEES